MNQKDTFEPILVDTKSDNVQNTSHTEATDSAPYHVEGRTVVMVTRSGKHLPVAVCDFLSADYVCRALSAYWVSENEGGIMYAFEEKDRE